MHKKIAVVGSVGSGKTTLINSLSQTETINTDVKSSVDIGKEMTTVGIDYGHIVIDENTSLGLYGVPGQRKYSLVWDFVKEGLWALVILLKADDKGLIKELEYLLNYFDAGSKIPCVIGITHSQSTNHDVVQIVNHRLFELDLQLPVYTVDSRDRNSALLVMNTLIALSESNSDET